MLANDQTELVLEQLLNIQRTLGDTIATIRAVQEEVRSQGQEASNHREHVRAQLANAFNRVGQLENDVKSLKQTMEKTVEPLLSAGEAAKNKVAGFMIAVSGIIAILSFMFWFFTGGAWDATVQWLLRMVVKA